MALYPTQDTERDKRLREAERKRRAEKMRNLSPKQAQFVEAFNGNFYQTAKKVGYASRNTPVQMMKNEYVIDAIQRRGKLEQDPLVADRIERERFFTKVMRNDDEKMEQRLKAAESLCKMNGDFIVKHEVTNNDDTIKLQAIRSAAMEFFLNQNQKALTEVNDIIDVKILNNQNTSEEGDDV